MCADALGESTWAKSFTTPTGGGICCTRNAIAIRFPSMRRVVLLVAVLSACSKTPEQKLPAAPPAAQPESLSTVQRINAEARALDSLPQSARFTPAYAA